MESAPSQLPLNLQLAIKELTNGLDLTIRLRNLLSEGGGSESENSLAAEIFHSFVEAHSLLKNSGEAHNGCRNLMDTQQPSPYSDDRQFKDSGGRAKAQASKGVTIHRRGCKRRRTSEAFTTFSSTPFEDGYVWRKYGQKEIFGAQQPRCYFRCTHKTSQGCLATKHVQRSETDPSVYLITYNGQHTCRDVLKPAQLVLDSNSTGSCVLNFESTSLKRLDHPFISTNPSVKTESIEEIQSNLMQTNSAGAEYLMPFDDITFDSYMPETNLTMTVSETGDGGSSVYSSTSSHTFGMDLMNTDEFDDVFDFNELGFI